MKELFKALAEFQNEVPVIHQNTKGYNYTYADLNQVFDVIKPLLKKHGLGFTQYLNDDSLNTTLFHIKSGEVLNSSIEIPKVTLKGQNEFQALGSGITYLRRYSLSCILGLITDKDADAAGEQVRPTAARPTIEPEYLKKPKKKTKLVVNSKPFHGGLTKNTPIEEMAKYFDITEEVATEYIKQLS